MKTPKNLLKTIDKIEKDCVRLKKVKQLTEYGEGQLDLIRIIHENN